MKKNTLEEIWNGETLISLRHSLNKHVIPKFCWQHHHGCPLIIKALAEGTNEIVMGVNDRHYLTHGWHELESTQFNDVGYFRWTSNVAVFKLKAKKNSYICINCARIWPVAAEGDIIFEGEKLAHFILPNDQFHTIRVLLQNKGDDIDIEKEREFMIDITNAQRPIDFDSNTQDKRNLGIMVSKIWSEDSFLSY